MELKEQIKGELLKQKEKETQKRREINSKLEEVTLYVNDTPLSKNIKEFLDTEGIKYTEKDITKNTELASKVISITNMNMFPTALVNGNYLVYRRDFQNPKQLVSGISYFGNPNYKRPTLEEGLVEWFKTSNYNLGQRLQRLEQMISPISKVMSEIANEDNAKKNK